MFVEKSGIAAAGVRLIVAALAILMSPAIGKAAIVVIDEAGMNAIFSQDSFGDTPISIRFNPSRLVVAPELLVIENLAELQALYGLATDPAPTVTAFFVDRIDFCTTVEPAANGLVNGCAQLPGHFFVEDFNSAQLTPDTLMGHELGHNLNLEHDFFDFGGLMGPLYPHGTSLREEHVALILQSPLVQMDATGQRFIQITPIAIIAPEPSTLLLLGAALGALVIMKTKKSTGTRI